MSEIYRGFEITKAKGGGFVIEKNGKVVASQPSLEFAYSWIDQEHRRRVSEAMR